MNHSPATQGGTPDYAGSSGNSEGYSHSPYEDALPDRATRRPHRKSRFGCRNCKIRRVKCDEMKPECSNCRHRRTPCDLATTASPSSSMRLSMELIPPSSESPPLASDLHIADIELMYHWTTSTVKTLTSPVATLNFWQTSVTEIAMESHHVLRLIFAFTALHLAQCRPTRRAEYTAKANQHYAKALKVVTSELANMNKKNCDAALICVELICLIGWARGPQPGEFLVFGANGRSEWLIMFRGIRTTMETLGYDAFNKSLIPQMRVGGNIVQQMSRPAFEKPLADLRNYMGHASSPAHIDSNLSALDLLTQCYNNRYSGVDADYFLVFTWLFKLDDSFLERMQIHEAAPLVLYAYFVVLLDDLERFWYMQGWTRHVLGGIWETLKDEDRGQIRWPMEVLGWIHP